MRVLFHCSGGAGGWRVAVVSGPAHDRQDPVVCPRGAFGQALGGSVIIVDPLFLLVGRDPVTVHDFDGAAAVRVELIPIRLAVQCRPLACVDGSTADEHRAERAWVPVRHATPSGGARVLGGPLLQGEPSSGEHGLVEHADEQFACGQVCGLLRLSHGHVPQDVRHSAPFELFPSLAPVEAGHADLYAPIADFGFSEPWQVLRRCVGADLPPLSEQVEHRLLPDRLRVVEVVHVERVVPDAPHLAVRRDGERDLSSAVLVGQDVSLSRRCHRRMLRFR